MRLATKFGLDTEWRDPSRAKSLGVHPRTDAASAANVRPLLVLPRTEIARREVVRVAARFDLICSSMGVSNAAMARRLGVSEKILRDYRGGLRRIPSDIWTRIGRGLAEEFLTHLLARVRGEAP